MMAASCIVALANLILNYIAIPIWGYIAAAYTTLICYILLVLAHGWFALCILRQKGVCLSEVYDLKMFLFLTVLACISMMLLLSIYDRLFLRYGLIAATLIGLGIKGRTIIERLKAIQEG